MKLSLSREDLVGYVGRQLDNSFPDGSAAAPALAHFVGPTLERVEHCFERVRMKSFHDAAGARFSHTHGDQYAIFLYYLANTIHRLGGDLRLAEKTYLLNKTLHGLDAFYEVALPDIFALVHPVGTVLGRARYADYFCAYHNCAVGSNLSQEAPTFGRGVVLFGASRVIGRCTIGDNCLVATGTVVLDTSAPDNSVIFGNYPNTTSKPTRWNVIRDIFRVET